MKRTTLLIGMMVIGAALVSAQGFGSQGARGGAPGAQGFGRGIGPVATADADEVELTGRLRLAEDEAPILVASGTEYILHIAPAIAAEIEVSNNQQVTVEGVAVERPSMDLLGSDTIVHVQVMEVGNDRYILPAQPAGPRGGAPGMMGPRFDDDTDDWEPRSGYGRR